VSLSEAIRIPILEFQVIDVSVIHVLLYDNYYLDKTA
jgi:hypothetical protein